jgi:hypothetical protein
MDKVNIKGRDLPKSSNVQEFGFVSPDATLLNCFSPISLILELQRKNTVQYQPKSISNNG